MPVRSLCSRLRLDSIWKINVAGVHSWLNNQQSRIGPS